MRILVVEDEVKVAAFVKQALEEQGHAVDVAYDGEVGWEFVQAVDYDLLILDWLLPRRTGLELCAEVRKSGRVVPILMLTARDGVQDRIMGLDMGADDYLTKPFALGELLARTRALLRRGSANAMASQLVGGDLALDPARRLVTRGAKEIMLSAKEYALLEYLMRSAGRPLSRSMIAEHVWDFDFDSGTNVVDVYINYLRNKIDRDYDNKLIHTVRGVGYRLGNDHDND